MRPHNQITQLKEHILGAIDVNTQIILERLCSQKENSFNKLITKCKKYDLKIKAKDLDLVIKAINLEANLSTNILATITCYLNDKNCQSLANNLAKISSDIEKDLPTIDILKSIFIIIDNLQIFSKQNLEEKFVRAIILLMLNFHLKQHNNSHNNYQDLAKWFKTLLAISEKSNLTQLVDYIAIRLEIASISIACAQHNLELTEIFFTFEEIINFTEKEHLNLRHEKLIKNINACILIMLACNKNSLAFVDITVAQIKDEKTNLSFQVDNFSSKKSQLKDFFKNIDFKLYYKKPLQLADLNAQAFLMCFSNLLHEELISKVNEYNPQVQLIKNFIIDCNHHSETMLDKEYQSFLNQTLISAEIIQIFLNNILPNMLTKLKDATKNTSTLNFIGNKLANLGFTPRSNNFAGLGIFTPIINKNKSQLDYENIYSLNFYINALNTQTKAIIIKELFISLLVMYRANPYKLENQPKPIHNKHANNYYQAFVRQHAKIQQINNLNYKLNFFNKKQNTAPTALAVTEHEFKYSPAVDNYYK